MGNPGQGLLAKLSRSLPQIYHFPVKIDSILEQIDFAFDVRRNQYHSTAILRELARRTPPNAVKILAIVEVDLFIPILTHVYGEALLNGISCIISTFRLKKDLSPINGLQEFESRIIKEASHELGHAFNLRHCREPSCLMHYCRTITDVDKKSNQFCRYCSVLLADELKRIGKETD